MKLVETIFENPSLFAKGKLHISISEITKEDFVELHYILSTIFVPAKRRKYKTEVYVNVQHCNFETQKELKHFISGLQLGMNLNDPSFLEKAVAYDSDRWAAARSGGLKEGVLSTSKK